VLPHASDFIVFFDSVSQPQLYSSITIGVTLALGICVSITYLLFFLFLSLKYEQALKLAVSVFLAGQLSNVVTILQQVDLLPSTLPLWNTNEIIADKHEFGQFFHVLFGYDATPTAAYLSLLILSTLIMFTFLTRQAKPIMMQMPNRVNRGQQ
jgi:high-affinity iron transporter